MSKSYIYAVGILLALSIYMLSGLLGCSREDSPPADMVIADSAGRQTMTVRIREVTAVEIPREVVVPGHTAPARAVDVRAEVGGRVEAVEAPRGSAMEEGAVILRLAANERPQRVEEFRALVGQRELEFEAAQRLVERNMQSENALADTLAQQWLRRRGTRRDGGASSLGSHRISRGNSATPSAP